jgi:hypothetical protein
MTKIPRNSFLCHACRKVGSLLGNSSLLSFQCPSDNSCSDIPVLDSLACVHCSLNLAGALGRKRGISRTWHLMSSFSQGLHSIINLNVIIFWAFLYQCSSDTDCKP